MQSHTDINETQTKNNSNLNPITSKPKPKMMKLITQIPTNCTTQTHKQIKCDFEYYKVVLAHCNLKRK